MTREEEILKASAEIGEPMHREGKFIHEIFCAAAKWADAHPVNPWHKVSEKLPEEHGWYFCVTSAHACGVALYDNESKKFEIMWATWGRDSDTVTHWMPIPKIWEVEI